MMFEACRTESHDCTVLYAALFVGVVDDPFHRREELGCPLDLIDDERKALGLEEKRCGPLGHCLRGRSTMAVDTVQTVPRVG